MNAHQVKELEKMLRGGAIQQELDDEHVKQFALHLRPLPYERTKAAIAHYLATPNDPDKDGHVRPKFVNSTDDLLAACDVNKLGRRLVADAARTPDAEVFPDLREVAGWSLVMPGEPPPVGVVEWRALNGATLTDDERAVLEAARTGALPPGARTALPAGEPVRIGVRLREFGRPVTNGPANGLAVSALPGWVEPMRAKAQDSLDALDRETARLRSVRQAAESEARALAELRAEAEADLTGGEVPGTLLAAVAEKLLRRLAEDPEQGTAAAVEVLAKACFPGLAPAELRFFPDDEDPATVRIVFKKRAE